MKEKFFNKAKEIMGILLLLTVIVLLSCGIVGKKQNEMFLADGLKLATAQQYINEGNLNEAEAILLEIEAEYPGSAILVRDIAVCFAEQEDYLKATEYYKKAVALNKNFLRRTDFLIQAAVCLYNVQEYNEAAKYFQVAKYLSNDQKEIDYISKFLNKISGKLGGENDGE